MQSDINITDNKLATGKHTLVSLAYWLKMSQNTLLLISGYTRY